MTRKIINIFIISWVVFMASNVWADVPVVEYSLGASVGKDITSPNSSAEARLPSSLRFASSVAPTTLDSEQRLSKLEQQINNINEQNLISKINELQERCQKLNGQVEDQMHQIEQLNTQLRDFYQDLNQRLDKSKYIISSPKVGETNNKPAEVNQTIAPSASNSLVTTEGEVKAFPVVTPVVTSGKNDSADIGQHKSAKSFLKEQQMYQTAIDLLPDKKYEASESKLRDYLKHYPKGAYVANAHYWLGEINFLQKNYDAAEEEFKIVTTKYQKSKRISDASFKLALVHQNQGRDAQAKEELQNIIKRYPNTSAAQLAKLQLEGN